MYEVNGVISVTAAMFKNMSCAPYHVFDSVCFIVILNSRNTFWFGLSVECSPLVSLPNELEAQRLNLFDMRLQFIVFATTCDSLLSLFVAARWLSTCRCACVTAGEGICIVAPH